MLREYSWDMTGYKPKSFPDTPDSGITRYMAERIFQLEPELPKAENINDYILSALREKDLKYFSFTGCHAPFSHGRRTMVGILADQL